MDLKKNMEKDLKKWKSFEDQLDILESRGLVITNRQAALKYLERLGYYRLSGYWYPFRQNEPKSYIKKDEFISGVSFEQVVKLYVFDKKLRLLVLDAIERIEMAIRVDIAYCLGETSALAYLEAATFHGEFSKKIIKKGNNAGKTQHQVWLNKFNGSVERNSKSDFVKHYNNDYSGKLPIWVSIELWDFGMMSTLYSGMKIVNKDAIAKKYKVKDSKIFSQWLRSLNHIRNISAHHSRLWNANIVDRSSLIEFQEGASLNNSKPFFYFCIIKQMLDVICPNSLWGQRLKALYAEFPIQNSNFVNKNQSGSVDFWEKWELWK